MKMKNKLSFIVFSLLILSVLSVSNSVVGSNIEQSSNIEFDDSFRSDPVNTDEIKDAQEELLPTAKELVIFADTREEFNTMKNLNNLIRSYEHLMAVRIDAQPNQILHIANEYSGQAVSANVFSDIITHQVSNPSQDIGTDHIVDANIMNVKSLWDDGYNGTGVVVAVYDNGVKFSHPGLTGQKAGSFDVSSSGSTPCRTHGTPVAGTIAGTGEGAPGPKEDYRGNAFGSKIYSVGLGCGDGGSILGDFLAGFDHIIANNDTIEVINTSWGGGGAPWDFITKRIEDAGQILVGSAGNSGSARHTVGTSGPGNSIHGVSVGAIDHSENIVRFSSRGPSYDMLVKPDVMAPGASVITTLEDNSYGEISGTSFSSPLTAGAVATLISAINNRSYTHNPGLLKAALMRGADGNLGGELDQGQGIVNLVNSWNLVDSATLIDNVPALVEMTPRSGPLSYLKEVPAGVSVDIPLTLISSHPENVSFGFTGDLSGIASLSTIDPDRYSQKVILTINTTGFANSNINGKLTASVGSDSINSSISMSVLDPISHTVGMDTRHTYWDQIGADQIGGSNTGQMVQLAMRNGYWVEEVDQKITSSVLSNYDIFWMPDPVNLLSGDSGVQEEPLLQEEINALVDYVEAGNSLFIDFNGYLEISLPDGSTTTGGTNITGMNKLISNFNITGSTTPVTASQRSLPTNNVSSIVGSVNKITHYGNRLFTGQNSEVVAKSTGGLSGTAIHTNPSSGGRVLVASTNFWMDNAALTGDYSPGENNIKFAKNSLNWLTQEKKVVKVEESTSGSTTTVKFKAFDGTSPASGTPTAEILETRLIDSQSLTVTDEGNNVFSVEITHDVDGIWKLRVYYGDDYIGFDKIVDTTGPVIKTDNYKNGTQFSNSSKYILTFTAFDLIDKIDGLDSTSLSASSFSLKVNDTEITENVFTYNTFRDPPVIGITLTNTHVPLTSGPSGKTSYVLTITGEDSRGNMNSINFVMHIVGDDYEAPEDTQPQSQTSQTDESFLNFRFLIGLGAMLAAVPIIRAKRK